MRLYSNLGMYILIILLKDKKLLSFNINLYVTVLTFNNCAKWIISFLFDKTYLGIRLSL